MPPTAIAFLQPGFNALLSTPYPAILKTLVMAAAVNEDAHFCCWGTTGNIKFWFEKT